MILTSNIAETNNEKGKFKIRMGEKRRKISKSPKIGDQKQEIQDKNSLPGGQLPI